MSRIIRPPHSLVFTADGPNNNEFSSTASSESAASEDAFVITEQQKAESKEALKSLIQDRKERKRYARGIFAFIIIWSTTVMVLMVQTGLGNYKFDNSVLITLLTTTTANVLALFVIVANYLFSRRVKA